MEIKDIKQRLSIETVLRHYNLIPNKHNMLNCPFHNDNNASMKIYPGTNTFNCFGCGKNGDTIEFIQEREQCTKHQALLRATELCGAAEPAKEKTKQTAQSMQNRTEILIKLFTSFQNGLIRADKPKEYLKSRNLWPLSGAEVEIGYNSGQFHHRGKLNETDLNACIAAGMLIPYKGKTPNGSEITYTAFAKDCHYFPVKK
jgi:DNA primase